jgi:hypothetical protein
VHLANAAALMSPSAAAPSGQIHKNLGDNIMKNYLLIAALMLTSTLVACGTTSNIKPSTNSEAVGTAAQKNGKVIDLSAYDKIVVLDFVDGTDKSKLKPDKARSQSDAMATAVRSFPDLIADKVRGTGAFQEVVRGPSPGKSLAITGTITRLAEGNASLRLWIGMGAGSSYFDATTDLADGESGASLGQLITDKNSWALGGALASAQTVQSFMEGAAEKIAAQLRDSKKSPPVAKAH